ncbi:hypothetical protein NU10_01440 [Flavobacterium dauae]|uniref:hypothetical protein n=1 Tax=Flavobacterium dauae TaxID=1563479 RepID=UPI00101B5066|nr:hypothetical protein [Flavobacterium dauae]WLD24084.1 hypothetical protein NU10_01440 [Flavobacterium dauae]
MKKYLLTIGLLAVTNIFAQNKNTVYNYDYNYANKMSRLWIDFDIIAEYDFLEHKLFHKDFTLKDGYIFKNMNDSLVEIGFYNTEQFVANREVYEMKYPSVGRIAIRKKGDKKWIRVNTKRTTVSFIESTDKIPEMVQFWAITTALQRELFYREKQLYERATSTNITVKTETSL